MVFYLIALVFVGKVSVLEILLLTLSSSLLYLGQTGSLLKKSDFFRCAGDRQRVSQRLHRILTINMSAEVFLHITTESWGAQSPSYCCPSKDSAQRRDGVLGRRNPLLRWSVSTSRHNTCPQPPPVLKRSTQEHKTSSGGSGVAFLPPPIHYFASPISQVHYPYQQWNELHEKVQGVAGTSGPHTARVKPSLRVNLSRAVGCCARQGHSCASHAQLRGQHPPRAAEESRKEREKEEEHGDGRWEMGGRQGRHDGSFWLRGGA